MLEGLISERRWQWAAYGKHPAARDYFKVGQGFPLLDSFSGWVENGYQAVAARAAARGVRCSWRFWTREARRENVVCGVVRDSADGLGRPYPLLVMGSGPLKDWANHWDLLPMACDSAWGQMEYIGARPFADLKKLEEEVQGIRPPVAGWPDLASARDNLAQLESQRAERLQKQVLHLSENMESLVPLDQGPSEDPVRLIGLCHYVVRSRTEMMPNVIFMGGTLDKIYCAFYRRPLTVSDFVQLWSLPEGG